MHGGIISKSKLIFYSKSIFVEMSTIKPATESTTNYEKKSTEKSMESTTVYVKASEEKTTKFTTMSTSTSMSTATKSSAASEQATKIVYNSSNTAKTKKALTIAGKKKTFYKYKVANFKYYKFIYVLALCIAITLRISSTLLQLLLYIYAN